MWQLRYPELRHSYPPSPDTAGNSRAKSPTGEGMKQASLAFSLLAKAIYFNGEQVMTWRGTTTSLDRFYAALPYALPMIEALSFGMLLLTLFPFLGLILLPLQPFLFVYGQLNYFLGGYAGLVIFFALYLLVVRNDKISHFIRFNTMQALLFGIAASLVRIVLDLLGLTSGLVGASLPLPLAVIYSAIFLGVIGASIFSLVQVIRGRYAEVPYISDAAYAQTRF